MSPGIRTRLVRLEQRIVTPTRDATPPPRFLWEVICGAKHVNDLPAADRARLEEYWAAQGEESRGYRLAAVRRLVDTLRTDFDLAGQGVSVPTPEELVEREERERGFCAVEEMLRLLSSPQETQR